MTNNCWPSRAPKKSAESRDSTPGGTVRKCSENAKKPLRPASKSSWSFSTVEKNCWNLWLHDHSDVDHGTSRCTTTGTKNCALDSLHCGHPSLWRNLKITNWYRWNLSCMVTGTSTPMHCPAIFSTSTLPARRPVFVSRSGLAVALHPLSGISKSME